MHVSFAITVPQAAFSDSLTRWAWAWASSDWLKPQPLCLLTPAVCAATDDMHTVQCHCEQHQGSQRNGANQTHQAYCRHNPYPTLGLAWGLTHNGLSSQLMRCGAMRSSPLKLLSCACLPQCHWQCCCSRVRLCRWTCTWQLW